MKTWRHFTNLPLSQFYRIATDNARPFYNVCGGAQDNGIDLRPVAHAEPRRHPHQRLVQRRRRRRLPGARRSRGSEHRLRAVAGRRAAAARSAHRAERRRSGPSAQNTGRAGAAAAAPTGASRRTGRRARRRGAAGVRPLALGFAAHHQPALRAPALLRRRARLSQRQSRRLLDGSQPAISRGNLDRDEDPDHGQGVAARTRWRSTRRRRRSARSPALDESPLLEGLLYVGTDDGLVQVTEDGGKNWRKVEQLPGRRRSSRYVTDV